MRHLFHLVFIFFSFSCFAQDLAGNWSGILKTGNQSYEQADIIYLQLEKEEASYTGITRIELFKNETEFAAKSFTGQIKNGKLSLSENFVRRSSKTRLSPECKLDYSLTYNPETGYLTGTFESSSCRNTMGEVIFFRSDHEINTEKVPASTHIWKHFFVRNYTKGYPAPEIMKKEQQNFKFETIHFDYDKSEIRPEYYDYLKRMARVLDGIHDLRVKITGHTDGDGTDDYNMGLSERRADALRDFFKAQGVDTGKLEIDFKGKREPVDSNTTKEGRQKNRRVVFQFI